MSSADSVVQTLVRPTRIVQDNWLCDSPPGIEYDQAKIREMISCILSVVDAAARSITTIERAVTKTSEFSGLEMMRLGKHMADRAGTKKSSRVQIYWTKSPSSRDRAIVEGYCDLISCMAKHLPGSKPVHRGLRQY